MERNLFDILIITYTFWQLSIMNDDGLERIVLRGTLICDTSLISNGWCGAGVPSDYSVAKFGQGSGRGWAGLIWYGGLI